MLSTLVAVSGSYVFGTAVSEILLQHRMVHTLFSPHGPWSRDIVCKDFDVFMMSAKIFKSVENSNSMINY